jgi:hypothetical protein
MMVLLSGVTRIGIEDLHALDRACKSLGADQVAHAIRLEDEDQNAAREIGETALQRQADRQTCGSQYGHERGSFDADMMPAMLSSSITFRRTTSSEVRNGCTSASTLRSVPSHCSASN